MSVTKYKIAQYLPNVGCVIGKYVSYKGYFEQCQSFFCVVNFTAPPDIPATETQLEAESRQYADEVCAALNAVEEAKRKKVGKAKRSKSKQVKKKLYHTS